MKVPLVDLSNQLVGETEVSDDVFGLVVRFDLIKRVVDWQRAKQMSGCHKVKTVSEVSGSTRKPFKQKGTGNARQGNNRAVQLRGGGIAHGPQVRSHAYDIPKKVRKLALRHALSSKMQSGHLHIVDSLELNEIKTGALNSKLKNFSQGKMYLVEAEAVGVNLSLSSRNLFDVKVAPVLGLNVYDIMNSGSVLISKHAISFINKRLD